MGSVPRLRFKLEPGRRAESPALPRDFSAATEHRPPSIGLEFPVSGFRFCAGPHFTATEITAGASAVGAAIAAATERV